MQSYLVTVRVVSEVHVQILAEDEAEAKAAALVSVQEQDENIVVEFPVSKEVVEVAVQE